LRNQELKQAGIKRKQVWRPKDKPDGSGRSAPTCMVCVTPQVFYIGVINANDRISRVKPADTGQT
jgi:hypothetical protein